MKETNGLYKWLQDNELSYFDFATKIKMTPQSVANMASWKVRNITYVTACKIYKITGLQPHEYVKGLSIYKKLYLMSK